MTRTTCTTHIGQPGRSTTGGRSRGRHTLFATTAVLAVGCLGLTAITGASAAGVTPASTSPAAASTAWRNGHFQVDIANVVRESNIVLGRPNSANTQAMPLGNGTLGVAAWAANGFTAQLNRADTLPDRLSPGQVVIPGLSAMTTAADFTGHVDLYDGALVESGGGMTMRAWVASGTDQLIVQVSGADPNTTQTAQVNLWSPRNPTAAVAGTNQSVGMLSETWKDNASSVIGSGQTFGSLAAITAGGRDVTASVPNPRTVQVSFKPAADGTFRVVIAAPHWAGGNAAKAGTAALASTATTPLATLAGSSTAPWHTFWNHAGLMQIASADGSGQYVENLRTIFLYANRSETTSTGNLPGSTSGSANLFNARGDDHNFYPGAYWFWNSRMLMAADLSTGQPELNESLYNYYLSNIENIRAWTAAHMGGLPGLCVPETMRFNGNGYQHDDNDNDAVSCQNTTPTWNGETVTSGAELSLWIWRQYLQTRDAAFLKTYAPLILGAAEFLVSYAYVGNDGLLHTVSNAHETQWDVPDPTTTIAAMQALFPVAIQVARIEKADTNWISRWTAAGNRLPAYARTDAATHTQLLTSAADADGTDVIGDSYDPTADFHNVENIGLEPVWPYNVIGDDSGALTALANRTYDSRPNVNNPDWTEDPIDAARLDKASEVKADLLAAISAYQPYVNGLGTWVQGQLTGEPMIEQSGNATVALDEALATDYDGVLRIAPAWPSDWTVSGTVFLQDQTKVDVQVQHGTTVTAAIESGLSHKMTVRNPWPGQSFTIVDGQSGRQILAPTRAGVVSLSAAAGRTYLVQLTANPTTAMRYASVSGAPASVARTLGDRSIGLAVPPTFSSLSASYDNVAITADNATDTGNIDGGGASMSATAMAKAGAPSGTSITINGQSMPIPTYGTGKPDNALAFGQNITMTGTGSTLGLLYTATWGPVSASGVIRYTDGTTQTYTLSAPDWQTAPGDGQTTALTLDHQNRPGNSQYAAPSYVLYSGFRLQPDKTVASVQLPAVGPVPVQSGPELHVFSMVVSTPAS